MSDAFQSLTGTAGLAAWIVVVLAIVGVVELMRFLAARDSAGLGFRQVLLIVMASVVVVLVAGGGGLLLMRAA